MSRSILAASSQPELLLDVKEQHPLLNGLRLLLTAEHRGGELLGAARQCSIGRPPRGGLVVQAVYDKLCKSLSFRSSVSFICPSNDLVPINIYL